MSPAASGQRDRRGGRARGRGDRGRRRLRDAAGSRRSRRRSARTARPPLVVPGTSTANVAAVRAAFGRPARERRADAGAARASEHPNDPVVQFNYATALFCAGFVADADQAYRDGEEGRPRHVLRGPGRRHPPPAVLHQGGYPPFQSTATDPLLVQGALLQRQGHQHSAERAYRARRSAAPGRRRGAGRRRRRAVRHGRPLGVVLPARPARGAVSAQPDRSGSTSGCCSPGRGSATRRSRSSGSPARSGPKTALGKQAASFPGRSCDNWD